MSPTGRAVYDKAVDIEITDSGSYYTGTEVETALQEIVNGTITFDSITCAGNILLPDGGTIGTTTYGWLFDETNGDITTTANVGIGTASPGALLDVRGSAIFNEDSADVDFRVESNGNANMIFVNAGSDRVGIGTGTPSTTLDVNGPITVPANNYIRSNSGDFYIKTANTTAITVDENANVGIGTTEPNAKLQALSADYPVIRGTRSTTQTNVVRAGISAHHKTTGDMADGFGAGFSFDIEDVTGVVNPIAGVYGVRNGADDSGALHFQNYNAGAAGINMIIDKDGDVVIGTDTPAARLHAYLDEASAWVGKFEQDSETGYGLLVAGDTTLTNPLFKVSDKAGTTNYFRVEGSGDVGIGGQPSYQFDVAGLSRLQECVIIGSEAGSPCVDGDIFSTTYARLYITPSAGDRAMSSFYYPSGTNDEAVIQINNSSNLSHRGRLNCWIHGTTAKLVVDALGAAATLVTSLKIGEESTANGLSTIDFRFNGTDSITMKDPGYLGVGTTNPDTRFEVNMGTSDKVRLSYNDADGSATDYTEFGVDSNGGLTITTVDSDGAAGNLDLVPDGITTIGDGGTTNYAQFATDGELTLAGTARVTQYTWISAGAIRGIGSDPASETTNGNGYAVLSFADNVDQWIRANLKIPVDMDFSADSYICIGWSSPTTSANAIWDVKHLITAVNDATDVAGTTTTGVSTTSSSTADGLVSSPLVTISGGTISSSDICIHIQIMRDGNNASDTLGNVAEVHGAALLYTKNKLGAAT